ncbi:MAG: DUF4129 domain-containing protein [Spirochaetota bacterium]
MRQHTYRAAVWLLGAGSVAALIFILGTSFADAASGPAGIDAPVPLLPEPLFVALLVLVGVATAAIAVRYVVALARDPGGRAKKRSPDALVLLLSVLGALAVVFVVSGLVLSLMEIPDDPDPVSLESVEEEGEPEELDDEQQTLETEPESPDVDPRERTGLLIVVAAAVAAALAVVATLVVWRRYARVPEADEREKLDRLSSELRRASGRGLERMLDEPDHRRAVIAAYALVEQTLERNGYPHARGETPVEFMRATLARLADRARRSGAPGASSAYQRSREALLALTRLYEVAKFSDHPIGERERAQAVESLERIGEAVAASSGRGGRDDGDARSGEHADGDAGSGA